MAIVQFKNNVTPTTATSITTTFDSTPTAGNGLVFIHRYTTNVTTMTPPAGATVAISQVVASGTWMHQTVSYMTSAGTEGAIVASTGGADVVQELTILEYDGSIDALDLTLGEGTTAVTTTGVVGPTGTLHAGDKLIVGSVGLANASGGWGAVPAGWTELITVDRLRTMYVETAVTTAVDFTQTWTTSSASVSAIVSLEVTPNPTSITFPPAPSNGEAYTFDGITWDYNAATARWLKRKPVIQDASGSITQVTQVTAAEYAALSPPTPGVLYVVVG